MASYCQVKHNWDSDHSTNVTRYSFIDVDSSDYDKTSYENRINSHEDSSLQFFKEERDEHFIVTIVCNSPDLSQINGVSIDSESKTLEISNDMEGYIKTIHGRTVMQDSNTKSSSNKPGHFVCSTSFDKSYSTLSIKFLSLGKRKSLHVWSMGINLKQHSLDSPVKGAFDITRLKKEIDGMGDSVSEKALDFLSTMEIYEQNKTKSLGHSGLVPAGLNGMGPGIMSIMKSVLGDENMKNLEGNSGTTGPYGGGGEENDIFSLLQSVCGTVTQTRLAAEYVKEISELDDMPDVNEPSGEKEVTVTGNGLMVELMNQRLEEAKNEMKLEMDRVKQEVMRGMAEMRDEMNEKLDAITSLLQKLTESGTQHSVQDG